MNPKSRLKEIEVQMQSDINVFSHIHKDTQEIIKDFREQTQLDYKDFGFMLLVTSLHLVRQYLVNEVTKRKDHNKSDKSAHNFQDKIFGDISDEIPGKKYYYASRSEICGSYSVPYDVINGSKKYDLGGLGKGLSGKTHRHYTLGHDPLLGLYFGTGNILTNTCTTIDLSTVHVKGGQVVHYGRTPLMVKHFHERIQNEPTDVALALIKQSLHIWSDTFSKDGIQLPFLAKTLDYSNAKKLTSYGLDFGNTVKFGAQYMSAEAINYFARLVLCLLYDVNSGNHLTVEPKVYKVIAGANILATSSSVIEAAITKSIKRFDFGGLLATIHEICNSRQKIIELQREFLDKEWINKLN